MNLTRFVSLQLRKIKRPKRIASYVEHLEKNKIILQELPENHQYGKKVLIVKTEDIGDYLLFRNFLEIYSIHFRSQGFKVTFLANSSWRQLFEYYDHSLVDEIIWLDKDRYRDDEQYLKDLFLHLRNSGFQKTICPERWRHIAWTDCIAVAAASPDRYAVSNTDESSAFNKQSDLLYNHIYESSWDIEHEFSFNKNFTEWVLGENIGFDMPFLSHSNKEYGYGKKIIFNIAASKKSKRWPVKNWIKLIDQIKQHYPNYEMELIGGKDEKDSAQAIQEATQIKNQVGKCTISETIYLLPNADLIITHDSFALHAAVSLGVKQIIVLANGNNDFRFSNYTSITNQVQTIYPSFFVKKKKSKQFSLYDQWFYDATSSDMTTISVKEIMDVLVGLELHQ